ncbi:helix-turn-helix domain-containing protein [Tardiphaga sp.]|jgi:AraC family transcriptional regulator|uniref:helix-turn-helix domain-containing protein n=1 Tax=Tardiphaga sp. TaxID=1926292 RepID=UPI0037DA1BBF
MLLNSQPDHVNWTSVEATRNVANSMALSQLLLDAQRAIGSDTGAALRCIEQAVTLLGKPAAEPVSAQARGGLARWQIEKIKRHIESNLDDTIQVADLASIARLSAGYFSNAFKVSFGQSPHAYIVARRLDRAKELMISSELSLCAIAFDCGFSDQAHLCRQFRRATGASPNAWRRSQCNHAGQAPAQLQAA